ncbi:lysylphosphatidylglycerol synthase domain-containing protein [Mariniflexile ostreae]|uniref:Lysylphosphatidylglycerol synthase domain-containing protein n=1 Tax=Mariniflexile ostreae TaxID=1520892 RepID=A0ABV5FA21_9FLAO
MTRQTTHKTKQFFFVLLKLSSVVAAFYFIYYKLTHNPELDFKDFTSFLLKSDVFYLKNIVFLVFLSLLNWFFEVLKWQTLVGLIKEITFKQALEQTLGSLTVSLFTPNRIGEYGAKALYFVKSDRKLVVLITLVSNILQMLVTTILGVSGGIFFLQRYPLEADFHGVIKVLFLGGLVFMGLSYFVKRYLCGVFKIQILKIQRLIKQVSLQIIGFGFLLSLCRYVIFSFQFYYVLSVFGIEITYLNAMVVITFMYFLASVWPSIFLFDVLIKGSVAVYLFSFLNISAFAVLASVTIMWLLNFVLPSFFGSYYVMRFSFSKNTPSI